MALSDLPPSVIEQIRGLRYDRMIGKHEGPEDWSSCLKYGEPDVMNVRGYEVLLPIPRTHHPNVTILRNLVSQDGNSLTVFLKDTTHVRDPDMEMWGAGFIAVCDKLPGAAIYVAVVYHEWFIIPFVSPST